MLLITNYRVRHLSHFESFVRSMHSRYGRSLFECLLSVVTYVHLCVLVCWCDFEHLCRVVVLVLIAYFLSATVYILVVVVCERLVLIKFDVFVCKI